MDCRETIVLNRDIFGKRVIIERYDGADYISSKNVPLKIKLNVLRYSIAVNYKWINKDCKAHIFVSNIIYRLKQKLGIA